MSVQSKIDEYNKEPLKIGDKVYVRGLGLQDKKDWGDIAPVTFIYPNGNINVNNQRHGRILQLYVSKGDYKKYVHHIGYNPIVNKPWDSELRMVGFSLDSILGAVGVNRRKVKFTTEKFGDVEVQELNWNPVIIDADGNEVVYQRGFVWSLRDKQLLIESIYNNINIGTLVIRKRAFKWVEDQTKLGKTVCFKDIVDGKQRLNAIIGFIMGEFPDLNGMHWADFSEIAKRKFTNFSALGYGELGESATDADTKRVFLGVNFSGVKMSQDQIDFVKSIKL